MAYDLYRLECYRSPQKSLGIIHRDKIEFAIFSRTSTLASEIVDHFNQMCSSSNWFGKLEAASGKQKKKLKGDTLFPKRINVYSGPWKVPPLGRNVYEAIFNEVDEAKNPDLIQEALIRLTHQITTRFMKPEGGILGKIWVTSSKTEEPSVVNELIDKLKRYEGVKLYQPIPEDGA